MDLVVTNAAAVITMNRRREVLRDAEVLIQGGRVARVGPPRRGPRRGVTRVLDARGKVVLPGLIHAHLHACQTLLRNHADGLSLLDWLRERVWPFEASHDAASMRASADLTFLECLRAGATGILDMGSVHHYGAVFEAARDAGVRLVGGKCLMDAGQGVPAGLRQGTQAALAESERLIETWHGQAGGRLRYALAPRFILACSEALLQGTRALADQRGVRVHTHAAESTEECDAVRTRTGVDYLEALHRVGLLGPDVTLAHCVWLTAHEQKLLRESGAAVAHCPSANLKLASGIARVPELLAQGVPVGLGADGAPCNNTLDPWVELRLAALLHLPRVGPRGFSALQALELATLGGARALGLAGELGALEEGYLADLILVDLAAPHLTPASEDLVGTLVYAGKAEDVTDVVVGGEVVVRDRRVLTLDEAAVRAAAAAHAARLLARLGPE